MARDGSGTFNLAEASFVSGTTIESAKVNSNFSDIASGLTGSLAKDGQTTPTANLPMGGFKHTGVADGSSRTDYASLGQVAKGTLFYAADTGSADAYAVAPSPGIAANVVGFTVNWKVANANLTTTPTLAVNGLTAGTIVWPDGTALVAGDLPANAHVTTRIASLASTTPTWHLETVSKQPAYKTGGTYTGTHDFTGATITVPTQARTDSSTKPASTAFVQGLLGVLSFRNKLINGDFEIDQRNEGASQTFTAAAAVAYTVDRWYASCTGANITGQRVAGTSNNRYAYKFTGAASNTAVLFGQRIEAANAYPLVSQTVAGSLQVKSSSITSLTWTAYYANSADDFSSKTQIATGTLTITSTLASYSFSFSAGANAGSGIAIEFSCGALLATQTLQFENVQFEAGSSATSFERVPAALRLAQCQRYYEKTFDLGTALGASTHTGMVGGWGANANYYQAIEFRAQKRAAPTMSTWDGAGNASKTSYYSSGWTDNQAVMTPVEIGTRGYHATQAAAGATLNMHHYAASAEL